ncbi:hypothetical protein H6G89_04980 [Oscillatoria sp. FACHB-1407]|uniref:hypothetical protein n=1 Tax=Oscillatoria sp. FACHB-1407 TaxID=2692847 RepID=UPI0016875100|nr:hypothetical protein [Oscillatoria sp. FACHB-1407]MBD2460392.1 hypothetical protein [Oscillatoria sp. FACHB-1407]
MLELTSLFEFSRTHCVAICAFLVPANLLATAQTLFFVGFDRPMLQVRLMTMIASFYALVMVLHVGTWLMIGVVMVPTFVLLWLGTTCLAINGWAIAHPNSLTTLLRRIAVLVNQMVVPNLRLMGDRYSSHS